MDKNPNERARALHSKIKDPRKRRSTTTAVGQTQERISIVGTSDRYLRKEIREAMNEDEIVAPSVEGKHAEQNVMAEAEQQQLTVTDIGASRPVCADCEAVIKAKGIRSWSPFSGKKSKKRKA